MDEQKDSEPTTPPVPPAPPQPPEFRNKSDWAIPPHMFKEYNELKVKVARLEGMMEVLLRQLNK